MELAVADAERSAKRAAATQELIQEVIEENLKKSLEIAKTPLYTRVHSDGKIELLSTGWSFRDGIKLGEIAAKMYGLTKAEGAHGDLREEDFEHIDFPAQNEKAPGKKPEEEKEKEE